MRVDSLKLQNFRNISAAEIKPCSEMNVIYGENAQGKTNILEALWLFCGAKSFRNSKDINFIKFGEEKAKTEAEFEFSSVNNSVLMEFSEKRTAFLNEKKLPHPSALAGNFNAIIFSPADLSLVGGAPSERRKFIDISVGQLYPKYIDILKNYKKAVLERNKIIKDFKFDGTLSVMLDVFEEEIAKNGEKIIVYREKYIKKIKEYINGIYNGISSGREKIDVNYINCGENLLNNLREKRKEDMFSGVTSVGPHRDDIEISINGKSVKNYGSQGQKRSCALSLKLSGAQIIKEISGEYPICLLDDVMSELDKNRQDYILNHIKGWQSFITCCDYDNISGLKEGKTFNIRKGEVF